MRRHIEVLMSKTTDNEIKEEQNYERTDKFNSIGLLMYIYWGLKRRINSTVEEEYQHKKFEELEYFESPLPEIVTREFEFEVLFPLISIVLKDKIAYPLLYDVSMEILSYYWRVLNPENLQFPGWKVTSAGNAGENYKSLLQSLFEYIGTHKNNEEKPKVCLELFKKLINLYDPLTMEDILFDMIVEAKHDKEKALLVDYYKDLVMKVGKANPMVSVIDQFKDHIKLLLDHHFDTKNEYIFDISERIISTLNLWRSLYILEKNRSEICENAQKIHEKVTWNICDDVSKLIDTVQPGLEAERDKALSNESIQSESKDMMNQTWCTNLMKLDIIREVIARIRSL